MEIGGDVVSKNRALLTQISIMRRLVLIAQTANIKLVLLLFSGLLLLAEPVFAQREIPFAESTFSPCEIRHLSASGDAPPYVSDMPYEVILAYMAIDSICKLDIPQDLSCEQLYWQFKDTLSTENIKELMKYLFVALDYDPMLFHDYLKHGFYINERYKNRPQCFYEVGKRIAYERLGAPPVFSLAFADGIYEIQIDDVRIDTTFVGYQRTTSSGILNGQTCISASVIDVLKGDRLLEPCDNGQNPGEEFTGQCLEFSYGNDWFTYLGESSTGDKRTILRHIDSNGVAKVVSPLFSAVHNPEIGKSYLVFVEVYEEHSTDNNGIPYIIFPYRGAQWEGGLFEIINGLVQDSGNYFGLGSTPSIESLKNNLRSVIDEELRP